MGLAAAASVLVSIFTEGFLYGVFALLFSVSTAVLLKKRTSSGRINVKLLSVSVIMFILATLHAAVNLSRVLVAFVFAEEPALEYLLGAISSPMFVLKNAIYIVQTLIGDGFLIYRLYLVWNGFTFALIPLLTSFVASIGVGIGMLQSEARAGSGAPIFVESMGQWLIAFFSLTLFTDLSCTALIAYRIWSIHRHTQKHALDAPSLTPAISIIVESGAVYSFCVAVLLGLYVSGSYYHKIMLDGVTQLIGVVFSVIIIRVGLGISAENDQKKLGLDTLFVAASSNKRGAPPSGTEPIAFQPFSSPSALITGNELVSKPDPVSYPPGSSTSSSSTYNMDKTLPI